jgi:DNA topoisomerase III
MRLFIAEKPSLARAIADALPGPRTRRRDFIECGPEDVVTWCAGHILELAEPEQYTPAYKAWRLDHLPIAPAEWRLAVTRPELLRTIRTLLPKASRVVHAGDPDREGQLLVDEVLEFLGYRGPVDRLLISDLNLLAVRRALGELQSNARYRGLYEAALARQRADWLFGINLTRLYTLLGRAGGYDGVLSVGRVQTPLLGLIVRRDIEIEQFKPKRYYVVRAEVRAAGGQFSATWHPPDSAAEVVDVAGRLISREHASAIRAKVIGQSGQVTTCSRDKRSEPPPLAYSLPDLQVDAGKRLGLGPKETLDACQSLYETHRMLTYPRSDCRYVPEGQHEQATVVLAAIATNIPALVPAVNKADRSQRSRVWNDKKITAHHAIIPTVVAKSAADLTPVEARIYDLVARRYVVQFHAAFEYDEMKIELSIQDERFRAWGRQTVAEGWRSLVPNVEADNDQEEADDDAAGGALPFVSERERITCADVSLAERQTTPPKRFTESSLIQAMTGIARYVEDPNIKQLLRETDGIGTPATQAAIIQILFDRAFIEKRRRQIASTSIGRALIEILPDVATRPDMTALWEAAMRRIADGQMPLAQFLTAVLEQLRNLVDTGRARGSLSVPGVRRCPAPGCTGALRSRKGQHGSFWACTRYPACRFTESVSSDSGPRPGRRTDTRARRDRPKTPMNQRTADSSSRTPFAIRSRP